MYFFKETEKLCNFTDFSQIVFFSEWLRPPLTSIICPVTPPDSASEFFPFRAC
jgi:hypothetical protein